MNGQDFDIAPSEALGALILELMPVGVHTVALEIVAQRGNMSKIRIGQPNESGHVFPDDAPVATVWMGTKDKPIMAQIGGEGIGTHAEALERYLLCE